MKTDINKLMFFFIKLSPALFIYGYISFSMARHDLMGHNVEIVTSLVLMLEVVGRIGFEPMTNGLKARCSTS